jgi:hypothetical protein
MLFGDVFFTPIMKVREAAANPTERYLQVFLETKDQIEKGKDN